MYIFEANIHINDVEKEVVVVFSGQSEGEVIDYSFALETGFKKIPTKPEEVLFVYPNYISERIVDIFKEGEKAYENIIRYGEDIPVTMLGFDQFADLTAQAVNGESLLCSDLYLLRNQIIDSGVFNLARKRKDQVILKAPSGSVFIKPSNKSYAEFIKASELAVGYSENQFVAFSLLSKAPKNRNIRKIYIDTNSISSFVEAVLYYWTRFSNLDCKPATYQSYGSYEGKDKAKPDDSSDVWLIISASRSNSMGINMAKDWGLSNDQVLTLLSYTETCEEKVGDETLVDISVLSECATKEKETGSLMKVKVWGENFTAEVKKPNPVLIKATHNTKAIGKWVRPNYNLGLIQCNRLIGPNLPLRSVYINCESFFSIDDKFTQWLIRVIDWYVPPKIKWLVYREIDSASAKLASIIEQQLHDNGISGFTKIDIDKANKNITGDDSVVVAMPVTGSGETLLKLNRNLRISGHKGNRIFISPFVVSSSKTKFDQFQSSLIYGPNEMKYLFFSFNNIFIGHEGEKNSWEKELSVIEYLNGDFWEKRASLLRDSKDGLNGFIGTPSIDSDTKLEFTQDFAFWSKDYVPNKVEHEAVYLTVSSILQGLREKPHTESDTNSLFNYVYQHSVISPDNFTRFNDSLLQSCLWRAANSRELDYRSSPDMSREFCTILERLIDDNADGLHNAAVDLLMGVATGRIQLSPGQLRSLLDKALSAYATVNENAVLLVNYIFNDHFPEVLPPQEEISF
jgi:hypothetical protein